MSELRSSSTGRRVAAVAAALALVGCSADPDPFAGREVVRPELFASGVVSTDAREYGIAFAPSMTEAYFARRPRRGRPQIFVTRFTDGAWSEPEVASFSLPGDESPFVSADGGRVLFSSQRPLPMSGDRSNNIWEAVRTEDGWGGVRPIPGDVNRAGREVDDYDTGRELAPVLLADGSLLYASGTDPEWGTDLFVAVPGREGSFVDPEPLTVNSVGDESHPAMSPDQRYLVFQAYRDAGGVGDQDLYVSERTAYGWTEPRPLPEPINSERADGYPSFSPDGRFLFFASDRDARGGYYSIYFVRVEALRLER